MPIRVHFGLAAMFGFLLTLTRVSGALVLLPMPGFKDAPQMARIGLILGTTFCLFPVWPNVQMDQLAGGQYLLMIMGEAVSGLILGLAIAFLNESFQLAAQIISMQAGFGFASTFDPNTQADVSVFQMLTQLATGLLFFALNIHHHLLRFFATSFDLFSPARTAIGMAPLHTVIKLGEIMLITGLKTGLPVVTLLILIDLALAVMSRLHAQMQLITITFPAKIVLSFLFVAAIMTRWPTLYQRTAQAIFETVSKLVLH